MTENKFLSDSESSDEGDGGAPLAPEPSAPPMDESPIAVATPIPQDGGIESGETPPSQEETSPERSRATASGVAAGILGLFLGGPILALFFGGGAAYVATTRSDAAGDAARSLGDVALGARDRAVELDDKHQIADKARDVAGQTWEKTKEKARELDGKHHVVDRAKGAAGSAYQKAVELNREHHIIERAVAALGSLWAFVSSKIWEERGAEDSNPTTATQSTTAEGGSAPTSASKKSAKA